MAVLEIWSGLGESEGESEGVSEIGELGGLLSGDEDFSGSSDDEVGNWGSWDGTVLSEIECAGCHAEEGSLLQREASVGPVSPQGVVGSTDQDRVEMSSSWSPCMLETDGADQFEVEAFDGSPHAFAHGSSMPDSNGGCVES